MKNLKKIFFKYLIASFGSALVLCIYSLVDAMCVGQYYGQTGTAALAVVMPMWTLIYSIGLLFGIGGATLMTNCKGRKELHVAQEYYTLSCILALMAAIILWIAMWIFHNPLLRIFGAKNEVVFSLAKNYSSYLKYALPVFMSTQVLTCFIRNDNAPLTATLAVICGGIFNIFGDIFLVFDFGAGMGIRGAGLATMIGQFITAFILLTHYLNKNNQLRFVKITSFAKKSFEILHSGLSAFILDIAMGVFTILFNNQIVRYYAGEEQTAILAIYGVVVNVVALTQSFAYAVGQASQPLLSESYGEKNYKKIKHIFRYGVVSSMIISMVVFALTTSNPNLILKIFMKTQSGDYIFSVAPKLMRIYFLSFTLSIFNVYSAYYFQSILRSTKAFLLSALRGILLSGGILFLLPILFSKTSFWWTMPLTEALIAILIIILMFYDNKKLRAELSSTSLV